MNRRACLLSSAVLVSMLPCVNAHTVKYAFTFSGANESPPVASAGTGSALVTFDLDLVTMRVEAEFSGLTGTTTAAHIHCCDFNASGNAGVATMTPSFTGFPLGVTAGTMDETFDMALASSYRAGYLTAHGGSVANALNDLLANLDNGMAYFNIHTSASPSGEIRGNPTLIPEPATVMLGLVGIGLPLMLRRSR